MSVRRRMVAAAIALPLTTAGVMVGGLADAAAAAQTDATVAPAPDARFEAESRTAQRGTVVVADSGASGGSVVAEISQGDWLRYDDVALTGSKFTLLCFASAAPANTEVATVDIRLGSRHATPTQSVVIRTAVTSPAKQLAIAVGAIPDGVQRVYLTVRQPQQASDFSLDYVTFTAFPPPPSFSC